MTSSTIVPKVVVMQNILLYRLEPLEHQKVDPMMKSPSKSERKPCKDVKRIFNQTYDIEREDARSESVLNTAFLETESDQLCPTTPDLKDGSWPSYYRPSRKEHSIQRDVWSEPESQWIEYNDVGLREECRWENRPRKIVSLEQSQTKTHEFCPGFDHNSISADYDDGWPCGDVWTQDGIGEDFDVVNTFKETYISPRAHELYSTIIAEDSLTSYETFMLGAAAAPHSSEVDLRTYGLTQCGCPESHCLSPEERAVGVAMEVHLNALRRLWVKAQELKRQTRCNQSFASRWDLPTRDPGPSTPSTPFKRGETFVKESFDGDALKSSEQSPRKSRERLRSRPGVIGIGMRHV